VSLTQANLLEEGAHTPGKSGKFPGEIGKWEKKQATFTWWGLDIIYRKKCRMPT